MFIVKTHTYLLFVPLLMVYKNFQWLFSFFILNKDTETPTFIYNCLIQIFLIRTFGVRVYVSVILLTLL